MLDLIGVLNHFQISRCFWTFKALYKIETRDQAGFEKICETSSRPCQVQRGVSSKSETIEVTNEMQQCQVTVDKRFASDNSDNA